MAGLTSFLGGFMSTPWLFMLGVLAIASPIIIHLLNKRKFKRVDWAAMDFLLEADKKNRRRVRLENLLLLLLRCLPEMRLYCQSHSLIGNHQREDRRLRRFRRSLHLQCNPRGLEQRKRKVLMPKWF